MNVLAIDDEEIKLNDLILPGHLQRMTIEGTAIVDKQNTVVGLKTTQHHGFNPKALTIELAIINTETVDVWKQVEILERAFSYNPDAHPERPAHFRLSCLHAKARRLKEVSFTGLKTEDTNRNDVLMAELSFDEYVPVNDKPESTPPLNGRSGQQTTPVKKPTDGKEPPPPSLAGFQAGSGS